MSQSPKPPTTDTPHSRYLVIIYKGNDVNSISEAIAFRDCATYDEACKYVTQHQENTATQGHSVSILERTDTFVPGLVREDHFSEEDDIQLAARGRSSHIRVRFGVKVIGRDGFSMYPNFHTFYQILSSSPNDPNVGFNSKTGKYCTFETTELEEHLYVSLKNIACRTVKSFYLKTEEDEYIFIDSPLDVDEGETVHLHDTTSPEFPKYVFVHGSENELPHHYRRFVDMKFRGTDKFCLSVPLCTETNIETYNGYPVIETDDIRLLFVQ